MADAFVRAAGVVRASFQTGSEPTVELFAPPHISLERGVGGVEILRSTDPLGVHARSMAHLFRANAGERQEQTLAAQREGDGWRTLSWGDARTAADRLAQALLDRGLGPDRPVMCLSGNSIEHLLLTLAAYTAGVPFLPVSVAYSLLSHDHDRIRAIADLCRPGLVFADDAGAFGPALASIRTAGRSQVALTGSGGQVEAFSELLATPAGAAVEQAFAELGPDSVAKVMFTSGSTGSPKGVLNTHRMLCSNQQALGQVWPFMRTEPPVLVDWLPWSHTFGGNHNVGQVLAFGGTIYIDDGKPTPTMFERTVQALSEVPPTVYYNVPAGYALLAPRLEQDRDFAATFFSRLRFMFYAAAALPQALWDRLSAVARDVADHPVPLTASWGTTETAPGATTAHFASARCGCIGVPLPGVTLKLVPCADKREIRVKGPNITPGYVRNAEATAAAFDDEGYYRTGDAARPVDPDDPGLGLMFDGRLAENFKLETGTWVMVGAVRTALVSTADGVVTDAVIAGHDRDYVAALAWIDQTAARRVCDAQGDVPGDHPDLLAHLEACLGRLNADAGSAARIERLLVLDEPPDMDAGEITDKGYVNQRAVLDRRSTAVERLFADPPGDGVVLAPH